MTSEAHAGPEAQLVCPFVKKNIQVSNTGKSEVVALDITRDHASNGVGPDELHVFRDAHSASSQQTAKSPVFLAKTTGLFGFLFTQRKFPRSAR